MLISNTFNTAKKQSIAFQKNNEFAKSAALATVLSSLGIIAASNLPLIKARLYADQYTTTPQVTKLPPYVPPGANNPPTVVQLPQVTQGIQSQPAPKQQQGISPASPSMPPVASETLSDEQKLSIIASAKPVAINYQPIDVSQNLESIIGAIGSGGKNSSFYDNLKSLIRSNPSGYKAFVARIQIPGVPTHPKVKHNFVSATVSKSSANLVASLSGGDPKKFQGATFPAEIPNPQAQIQKAQATDKKGQSFEYSCYTADYNVILIAGKVQ